MDSEIARNFSFELKFLLLLKSNLLIAKEILREHAHEVRDTYSAYIPEMDKFGKTFHVRLFPSSETESCVHLIIGVEEDENGRPKRPFKGLKLTEVDKVTKDLLNKCRLISPDYLTIVQPVDTDNNTKILIVWCPGGPVRPYISPKYFTYEKGIAKASGKTTCWIRKMANTVKPSGHDMADLYSLANCIPFDDQTCHAADMTNLNITLSRAYLKEI